MTLAICPQKHVWSIAGLELEDGQLVCPVCGSPGSKAAVVATGTNANRDTLSSAGVPPVAGDVTWIVDPAILAAQEAIEAGLPVLPGYDLVRELGRGGMGVVYLARHRELKRLVALKMILTGFQSSRETKQRFQREAEAVARLQHPGIVQIHDVGEHAGRPYFALEYVEGSNLAIQLDGKPIAARQAAGLLEILAQTIHYAHQRGIVHRDLTPRNILLARSTSSPGFRLSEAETDRFDPKITDFGLAKKLDTDNSQTQTGVIVGTPSYMSPEQAHGRPHEIGPATDVHALGAILYELLTGRPPFLAATQLETVRQVIDCDPVAPTHLQPRIPRDVETICLKCLAKDPRKRYASALELADDLHRFLTNEPIHARPVAWRERMGKWVRRHPAATALLAVVALSLAILSMGGVLYSVRVRGERDRAEMNFGLAMRAVDEMLSEVGEQQLAAEPRMEEKRRALLARALALNQEFLKQKRDDPRVRFETAQAYRRMADVLRLLEQHPEGLDAYSQAIDLFRRLHDESPRNASYRQQLAYCLNNQGEVLRSMGRAADAEAAYHEAAQFQERLAEEFPDVATYRQDQARTLYSLGILFREGQRPDDAERELRRAAELLTELVDRFPETPAHRQHLARAWLNLGTVIRSGRKLTEAQECYTRAIALLLPLSEKFPEQPDYRHELAVVQNNLGNLLSSQQRFEEARAMHRNSLERFQALAADFPRVPVYRQELANTWNSIGSVYAGEDQWTETVNAWNQAAALLEGLVAERDDVAAYQGDLGMVLGNLALVHLAQSQSLAARSHLERAVDRLNKALAVNRDHAVYREILRDNYQNLAEVLIQCQDHAAAAGAARALAGVFPDSAMDCYFAACFLARCAQLVLDDAQLDSSSRASLPQSYADESVAMLRQAIGKGFADLPRFQNDRETVLQAVSGRSDFQVLAQELAARRNSSAP